MSAVSLSPIGMLEMLSGSRCLNLLHSNHNGEGVLSFGVATKSVWLQFDVEKSSLMEVENAI